MVAQIVFDLPLDGPFDYIVPDQLVSLLTVGMRVKVSFGPRAQIGYCIGLIGTSNIANLKSIQSLCDTCAVFNSLDLSFAQGFSRYYGCSLGEALGTMLRNKLDLKPSVRREHKPQISLHRCPPASYAVKVKEIMEGYAKISAKEHQFLILVPDMFRGQAMAQAFKGAGNVKIGMRSSVFEASGLHDCVIMADEEDSSFKQEQMPMYETRQVLLTRSRMYGFDVAFVGIAPSVEAMAMVHDGKIKFYEDKGLQIQPARVVDLTNYKFVPGLISPPVRDAVEGSLKAKKKSVLILNRKGSYRITRCVDCAEVLKCAHCDSPLIYSRSEGKFLCRHCTYTSPGDTVCPKCRKPSWRSQGIGVEQLQSELKKIFPQAKIASFERPLKTKEQPLPDVDILISTQALLRYQGSMQVQTAAFIDFDAELNRLDMRCAFNAYSLVLHVSSMAKDGVLIQTRNSRHYVLQSLSRGKFQEFYDEELKLRKEFGFSPFKHWIKISWRGKTEKSAQEQALEVYNKLNQAAQGKDYSVTPPLADAVGRKRDQFRFNVMVQTGQVASAVAGIKSALAQLRRRGKVIVTMNVDP